MATLRRIARAVNKSDVTEEDVSKAFTAFGIQVHSNALQGEVESIRDLSGVDFEVLITGLLTQPGLSRGDD